MYALNKNELRHKFFDQKVVDLWPTFQEPIHYKFCVTVARSFNSCSSCILKGFTLKSFSKILHAVQ